MSYDALVEENTHSVSPPLCPELRLALLRPDAPLLAAAPLQRGKPHLFAWDGPRPYWAFAWGGGQVLARLVLDRPELVRGKRVLDFGAGSGIAGLAAARAGAARVTACDTDPAARAAIGHNAAQNGLSVDVCAQAPAHADAWDVLLAGDVFYLPPDPEPFLAWARAGRLLLAANPPGRGFAEAHRQEICRTTAQTIPELENLDSPEIAVYRIVP